MPFVDTFEHIPYRSIEAHIGVWRAKEYVGSQYQLPTPRGMERTWIEPAPELCHKGQACEKTL